MLAASEKCQFSLLTRGQSNPKVRALADTYGNARLITASYTKEAVLRADIQEQDARYLNIDGFSIVGIPLDLSCVRVSITLRPYLIICTGLCTIFTRPIPLPAF